MKVLIYDCISSEITDVVIRRIELALGIKLFIQQIKYLEHDFQDPRYDNLRGTGKTTAYCIKLALSSGEPLDVKHSEKFSDGGYSGLSYFNNIRYSRTYFLPMFLKIRNQLLKYGFKVRDIKNI